MKYDRLVLQGNPIIIWGTKTAGQICYRLLRSLNAKVVAAGDNCAEKIGQQFYDIPIMSIQQIENVYPDAFIVIASFYQNVSDAILGQLKTVNGNFSFCRFEEIEYLYETKYFNRKIRDEEKFFQIINNIRQDEEVVWKRKLNKDVMAEYRYVVHNSSADDLKEALSGIYGVKNLLLIISSEKMEESADFIEELSGYDNIGHIIIVLDSKSILYKNTLKRLLDKVFYVICDEQADKCSLEEIGFAVEVKKLPEELFSYKNLTTQQVELTEEVIVHSVLQFVNGKDDIYKNMVCKNGKSVHIVQLSNGLANQMLMYLFGRFLEEESGRTVVFDDTVLALDIYDEEENVRRISQWNKAMTLEEVQVMVAETRSKNSFYHFKRAEVAEVFDIPIHLLSDYFDEETWKAYLAKVKKEISCKYAQSFPLGQVLLKKGIDINVVRDNIMPDEFLQVNHCCCVDAYILDRPYQQNSITNFLLHKGKSTYYYGIWATGKEEDWLLGNRNWIREKFEIQIKFDKRNMDYAKEISGADGIIIHIRRGDFVRCSLSADTEYFRRAIQEMETLPEYKNKKYFIFSDDLEWCRKHKSELGIDLVEEKAVYVGGNHGAKSYIDMFLMSLGKVMIPTPGSSFGYVAMLISKTMEKSINMPKYQYYGIPEIIDIKSGL